jgi:hypothetical protein
VSRDRRAYAENPRLYRQRAMLKDAKRRATRQGVPFGLTLEWVEENMGEKGCPWLGCEWDLGTGSRSPKPHAPSIHRVTSSAGYVPDNCVVISVRANMLIGSMETRDELRRAYRVLDAAYEELKQRETQSCRDSYSTSRRTTSPTK